MLVGFLVLNYHMSFPEAWATTLREFFLVTDFKSEAKRRSRRGWDLNKLADLEAHINSLKER